MWPFRRRPQDDFAAYTNAMNLVRETRWSREYRNDDTASFLDSRFRDGSASISLAELTAHWSTWTEQERLDFCQAFNHYHGRERARILRFVIRNGSGLNWQALASAIAMTLPQRESLPFLESCCETLDIGQCGNFFQALWLTWSPDALPILRNSLDRTWESPELMTPDPFCNFVTSDAIYCIDAMVRLGEPTWTLADRYETLKQHPSMYDNVVRNLAEHFEPTTGGPSDTRETSS